MEEANARTSSTASSSPPAPRPRCSHLWSEMQSFCLKGTLDSFQRRAGTLHMAHKARNQPRRVQMIRGPSMLLEQPHQASRLDERRAAVQVFEDTKHLVQSAVDGFNVCIFAYGQTGSGKTFTMTGSEKVCALSPVLQQRPIKIMLFQSCYLRRHLVAQKILVQTAPSHSDRDHCMESVATCTVQQRVCASMPARRHPALALKLPACRIRG